MVRRGPRCPFSPFRLPRPGMVWIGSAGMGSDDHFIPILPSFFLLWLRHQGRWTTCVLSFCHHRTSGPLFSAEPPLALMLLLRVPDMREGADVLFFATHRNGPTSRAWRPLPFFEAASA